jgi:putative hemolysin
VSDGLRLFLVFLLIVGNAFFVVAEYALVTARRPRLADRSNAGSRGATVALRMMDNPVRFIGAVQVGITALGILLGALGEPLFRTFLAPPLSTTLSFVVGFTIITFLSVLLGELVPKAIALQRAESLAVALALPLHLFQQVIAPVAWLLQQGAGAVLRIFGLRPAPAGVVVVSEEEIRSMLPHAEDIEAAEEEMLHKVFDFADKEAHDVMVPRPEVVAVPVDLPAEECLAAVIDSPYTRYPAYRGTLDEIVGILHVRDLFSALYADGIQNVALERIVRPAHFVPETKDLGPLLGEFRRTNQHMAIVVDEYGATQGIVTLEDLLEEIVGEIEDEYDLPDDSVQRIDERRIRVDGTFTIDDFNERFDQRLPQEDYHTLAGFVFGELGRAPASGDEVTWDGLRFEVVETDGPRIELLEIEFLEHWKDEKAEQPERQAS